MSRQYEMPRMHTYSGRCRIAKEEVANKILSIKRNLLRIFRTHMS